MRAHERLVLVLPPLLAAVALAGCSLTREVRPVGQGNFAAGLSVGGPLFTNLGGAIPTPIASVYGRYGILPKLDLDFALDLTPTSAQGLDLGAAYEVLEQTGPAPAMMIGARGYMFVNADGFTGKVNPDTGSAYTLEPKAFEEIYANVSWEVGHPWLVYAGVDLFAQAEEKVFEPSILAGVEYRFTHVGIAAEVRDVAFTTNQKYSTFEYIGPGGYGALSFQLGLNIYPSGSP